ncbi:pentatricopeptide repeat-containing protein [Pyrus ussuriensis x Pyrus communis]|uniref:Pentatricopeptide repeat-containing protein n=1 Tax=Pyrus ussuriensis x Pyrus communis TaxID=2448454 RepID=A0A5N5G3I8_9ROSA|nr:pentatricopeptide repeat-containing protein [Pyrus ussuriensis x Pyrus communis]
MVELGLRVVACLGNRVFNELIENGKVVDCAQILKKMGEKDPKPDASFYDAVIRRLCDEGALDPSRDLLEEMVRYGIGVPPALQQFVIEVFGEAGGGDEIQRILYTNRWGESQQQFKPRTTEQHHPVVVVTQYDGITPMIFYSLM